jgi:hypothetical protein
VFIDPARVLRPRDKARVENRVAFVRERWFAGESFEDDLDALRGSAAAWCRGVAGMRVLGTTRQVPRLVFEQHELPHLKPVPEVPFNVPRWTEAEVHPDHLATPNATAPSESMLSAPVRSPLMSSTFLGSKGCSSRRRKPRTARPPGADHPTPTPRQTSLRRSLERKAATISRLALRPFGTRGSGPALPVRCSCPRAGE